MNITIDNEMLAEWQLSPVFYADENNRKHTVKRVSGIACRSDRTRAAVVTSACHTGWGRWNGNAAKGDGRGRSLDSCRYRSRRSSKSACRRGLSRVTAMPGQGRLGDKANVPVDTHGCPACPHPGIGPAIQGSPDVNVNKRPALRVDDPGIHAACCGTNTWTATKGSMTVFINGKSAHRMGDQNRHCGGMGQLVEGSPNVIVGDSGGGGGGGTQSAASGTAAASSGRGAGTTSGSATGAAAHGNSGGAATAGAGTGSSPASARTAPASSAPVGAVSPPGVEEHQLECALITSNGVDRPGVSYQITLPDGVEKTGSSGFDGVIRLSGLTVSGQARLFLPDIDARIPDPWSSNQGIPYVRGGVTIPVGISQVSLPPAVYRGRLTGMLFETDKCFLLPGAMPGIKELKRFYDSHPKLEVMVSGHADREGPAAYNLTLSVERAEAVEAFLQDQVDKWTPWYGAAKQGTKRWGVREDQHMLTALGHYSGPVHGRSDQATKDAINSFRNASGLGDGGIDDATRAKLIEKYMKIDGTTLPAGTKIQHHGCGEYHPEIETPDGVAEAENRRVEVFFFEGPVDPSPPTSCPPSGCSQYPEWRKRTIETIDINVAHELTLTLVDELGLPLKNTKLKVKFPDGHIRDTVTDEKGAFLARVKPGDSLELEIAESQEAAIGDGVKTPSGVHFHAGGSG